MSKIIIVSIILTLFGFVACEHNQTWIHNVANKFSAEVARHQNITEGKNMSQLVHQLVRETRSLGDELKHAIIGVANLYRNRRAAQPDAYVNDLARLQGYLWKISQMQVDGGYEGHRQKRGIFEDLFGTDASAATQSNSDGLTQDAQDEIANLMNTLNASQDRASVSVPDFIKPIDVSISKPLSVGPIVAPVVAVPGLKPIAAAAALKPVVTAAALKPIIGLVKLIATLFPGLPIASLLGLAGPLGPIVLVRLAKLYLLTKAIAIISCIKFAGLLALILGLVLPLYGKLKKAGVVVPIPGAKFVSKREVDQMSYNFYDMFENAMNRYE